MCSMCTNRHKLTNRGSQPRVNQITGGAINLPRPVGYLGPEPVAVRLSFDNDAPVQVTPNIAIDIGVNWVYELSEARDTENCLDKAITWL